MKMITSSVLLLLLPIMFTLQAFPLPETGINSTDSPFINNSTQENCSYPLFGPDCESINNTVRAVSMADCLAEIPEGFKEFYNKVKTEEGEVYCVSSCHPLSPFCHNCNGGECSVARSVGPQCSCPDTDYYIYTTSYCTGAVSKVGLGTGVPSGSITFFVVLWLLVKYYRQQRYY